jgi:hypothetical protein
MEIINDHLRIMALTFFSLLATCFTRTCVVSLCLALDATISYYRHNSGGNICIPQCAYNAASESSSRTRIKVGNKGFGCIILADKALSPLIFFYS